MAKIARKTQKIFCGNPTETEQTSVFGTMVDNATRQYSTDVETLQSNPAYEEGWKSAVQAGYKPFMEDFNTLNYINTSQLAYLFQQGIPEWDDGTTYYTNSFCSYLGKLWKSLINDNLNNAPEEGEKWTEFKTGDSGKGAGLELCDIGCALYVDESKGLRRYLNGSILEINTNTQPFLTRLQQITTLYPNLACTEEQWQSAKTLSKLGQVGRFVYNYSEEESAEMYNIRLVNLTTDQSTTTKFTIAYDDSTTLGVGVTVKKCDYGNTKYTYIEDLVIETYTVDSMGLADDIIKFEGDANTYTLEAGSMQDHIYTQGTTPTSVRLPLVKNINGLTDLANCGMTISESLPNITGTTGYFLTGNQGQQGYWTGAFQESSSSKHSGAHSFTDNRYSVDVVFNASASSSTYQEDAPVQQEAIQYPYFIQIATGQETQNDIINEIQLNNPFTLFDSKYVEAPLYNLSWLASNGQYNSGAVYVKAYEALVVEQNTEIAVGTTVTLPSGTQYTKRGLPVKLGTETYSDYDFVIITDQQTFRLPLKNGQEDLPDYANPTQLSLAANLTWTAPQRGYLQFQGGNTGEDVWLNSASGTPICGYASNASVSSGYVIPVIAGQTYYFSNSVGRRQFFKAVGDGSLYYYVGETSENANLIDVGRLGEEVANKININSKFVDGQWVSKEQVLSTAIAAGTYEIDLSDYLPADGYSYEMIITMRSTKGDKSGAFNAYIYSEAIASSIYVGVNSTYSRGQACCVTLPISNSHKMYYVVEATVSDTTVNFRAVGYRRIGTNQ